MSFEKWTEKDVHLWLTTEVKVHESCADIFSEQEVSGLSLVVFEKTDILDLGIKHGPAVKIKSYLESLKVGSKHESECPAYVENWTKEQVKQWLLQHVKIDGKYAEQLEEEDVSGDCLVCFKKQDFLDLGVKSGPAVRIVAELRQLNKNPEPTLQPILQNQAPKPTQSDLSLAQATTSKQRKNAEKEFEKSQLPFKKASEEEKTQEPKPRDLGARRKETIMTKVLPDIPNITVEIKKILDELGKDGLKEFQFTLKEYTKSEYEPISLSKLEDKDTKDTATLMRDHYGSNEALLITIDILKEIHHHELASKLEKNLGQKEQSLPKGMLKKEANQGDKLKNLLTCGENSLNSYDRFVVVVNKSSPEQVQYLQFLSKLKLFCVLDFDPSSVSVGGLCHSYRESRLANLHNPSQYQGQTESVIKKLNLYKQTSWVFCNGRHDLNSDSDKELDYKNWLRKSCRDVEQLVSFICNPEVLLQGRCLIIFLLLSPVNAEKDPIFDIYKSFIKHTEEESIITICESQSTYEKWRELIQEKCDFDIDRLSINELTLSEINGTVLALGPFNQPTGRLLPSSGSSAVVLKEKDEDFMTALDILCLNQCENIYDENSPEFHDFRIKVEEEFYRGGKVKWWNFYFCDKNKEKPFVKRDKYENVKKTIRSLRNSKAMCALFNLFHHPGCGGTTLAMQVMWDLRQEFRCAVLKDNRHPKAEVAMQVIKLMKLESEKPSPVLLLVDDSKETENSYDFVKSIGQAVDDYSNIDVDDTQNCKVIILNCVRSHSPKEQYRRHDTTQSQYITSSLTQEEKKEFEKKLKDLGETHEKPENFYSFMIMKNNFDPKYTADLAHNTLENFDFSKKEDRLFAFLALLNTYAADSEISLSLCQDFLGMKMIHWRDDSVLDRMQPYSNFLITDTIEEYGEYKGIRILHHSIASACLKELDVSYRLKVSDITMEILHCDLFFSVGVVKDRFMLSVKQMLIERQQRNEGDGREQFSALILKIHNQQGGGQTVQDIFAKASSRFTTSASVPQALARYLYINEHDFPEALKWAETAKNIKENPYMCDTIGQIHKNNLKSNINREEQETSYNPEDLNTNLKIAINATTAFKKAQELANTENEPGQEAADDESDDYPRKSYTVFGYVGFLEIAFLVFEILGKLPFFEQSDPMKKKYLQSFLQKAIPITSVYKEDNEINNRYMEIIREHEQFIQSLKTLVKEMFDLLKCYFMYIKGKNSEFDLKNHQTVCDLFKTYVALFCTAPEEIKKERLNNPNLNLKIDIDERRLFLEGKQADTFAGILQQLDKPAKEIEKITECYAFLQQQQQFSNKKQKTKETINYILSNIVLYLLNPKSKLVKNYKDLSALLLKTLQDVGLGYPFPDPYYLALLLFWPSPTKENPEIGRYVTAVQNSSRKHLSKLFRKRSTIAHFYLGKGEGLQRFVSKPKLDETFLRTIGRDNLAQLWRNGDIFREKKITSRLHRVSGITEEGEMFVKCGKLKIPVRPAHIGGIRHGFSTEKVSFYLGFAINGLLAYDIQYEN